MKYRTLLPSVEYLKECFEYLDGKLFYKERPRQHFKTNGAFKWHLNRVGEEVGWLCDEGYLCVILCGKNYLVHRLIYKMFHNSEPLITDHVNNCKTDNRIDNLKESNRKENKIKSPVINNLSGYRGVFIKKDRNSYEVRISITKKDVHVGYYKDINEAACAYNIAAKLLMAGSDNAYYLNVVDFDESLVNTNKSFFNKFKES